MSIIEQSARNILDCRYENLEPETVHHAKNRIIDVLGNVVSGMSAPGCAELLSLVKDWGGKGEATVLNDGFRGPAHNVALVNGVMARSYDWEVCVPLVDGILYPGHIGATTVPTALAMAEKNRISGKEIISALVAGDDFACRLAGTTQPGKAFDYKLGWVSAGTTAMFGATAVAGRLQGLDQRRLLDAFCIVLNQVAGTLQGVLDGAHAWKIPQGLSARAGIFSAELAGKGFTGGKDALTGKHAYLSMYSYPEPRLEILTKDLGKKFFAESTFKPYPCCRGADGGIELAIDLVEKHDIQPQDIKEVICNLSEKRRGQFLTQPFIPCDVPQALAVTNVQFLVANAVLRRGVKLEHFNKEVILDPAIMEMVGKTVITATLPLEKYHPHATSLTIKMNDGREFFALTEMPKGSPTNCPLTDEDINEKFLINLATAGISGIRAKKALGMLRKLEEAGDVSRIVRYLVK